MLLRIKNTLKQVKLKEKENNRHENHSMDTLVTL